MTATTKAMMAKMGFTDASEIPYIPRIILAVHGLEKQGKTHFALTAPGTISYLNLDCGLEGVIQKHAKGKDIRLLNLVVPDVFDTNIDAQEIAQGEWDKFVTGYYWSLQSDGIRSIVIDTASELRALQLLAHFGKTAQIMPWM